MRSFVVTLAFVVTLVACGASAREKTVHAALVATNAARDAFVAYDAERQHQIIEDATSGPSGAAALAAYRTKRSKIVLLFEGMYRAISVAAVLTDDPANLDMLAKAAGQLRTALHEFTGGQL